MTHDELPDEPIVVSDAEARRIAALARDGYRVPPETPREAMWESIAARRSAAGATPWRSRITGPWWMAVAAGALLAVGIGIGRWMSGDPIVGGGGRQVVEVAPTPSFGVPDLSGQESDTFATPVRGSATRAPVPRGETKAPSARQPGVGSIEASPASYRFAALTHLVQTEMLLTEYTVRTRSGERAQVGGWARDLLGTTRLLMDSPAADDNRLRALLEDLEIVLAQIVQHEAMSDSVSRQDDDFVERALSERALLTKLRSAVPAGAIISGS